MDEETQAPFDWKAQLQESIQEIFEQLIEYAPQILGALLLLLVGWIVAHILKVVSKELLKGLNALISRIPRLHSSIRIRPAHTKVVGQLIFWTVLALFFAASANTLGWTLLTQWLDSLVAFLPNLVSGLLILFVGILLGNFARSAVATAAARSNVNRSEALGRVAQAAIVFGFAVVGIEQIGLNLHFLTEVFVVVLGILLAGASLAFGLGARTLVANIIGVQRIRKHCDVGERIKIAEVEGEILEFSQTSVVIGSANGRTVIPAKLFQEQLSQIVSDDEIVGESETKGAEHA